MNERCLVRPGHACDAFQRAPFNARTCLHALPCGARAVNGAAATTRLAALRCAGFFLPHYAADFARHLAKLFAMRRSGELEVALDGPAEPAGSATSAARQPPFLGLAAVPAAIARLQSGASAGKVVVYLDADIAARDAAAARVAAPKL